MQWLPYRTMSMRWDLGIDGNGCLDCPVSALLWCVCVCMCVPKRVPRDRTRPGTLPPLPLLRLACWPVRTQRPYIVNSQGEVIQVAGQVTPTKVNSPAPWYLSYHEDGILSFGVVVQSDGCSAVVRNRRPGWRVPCLGSDCGEEGW